MSLGRSQQSKHNTLKYQADPGEIPAGLSSGVKKILPISTKPTITSHLKTV
jgi:hypothetical protein